MKIVGTWPNVEKAVIQWLKAQLPDSGYIVVNQEPKTFATASNPLTGVTVCVERIPGGGGGQNYSKDSDIIVTVYAATKAAVWDAVQVVEVVMLTIANRGTVSLDDIECRSDFGDLPYSNINVKRAEATYRITARPR